MQIERNETRKQRQLSSASPIQFYSTYLSSSRQKPHPAWALNWWSPYMVATAESSTLTSMAITPPESATTSYNANIQQSRATQLPVHFSRKCFPGAQGFDAEPLRAICGNCASLSPANANKDSQRTIHEGLRRDWINQAT